MRRVVDIVPDQQVQLDKDWVVSTATAAVLVATGKTFQSCTPTIRTVVLQARSARIETPFTVRAVSVEKFST